MKFNKMNLADLQTNHAEMLATAGDLGLEVPESEATEFDTEEVGRTVCAALHKRIQDAKSAAADTADSQNSDVEGVASGEELTQGAPDESAPATKPGKKAKSKAKAKGKKSEAEKAETKTQETTMAKTAKKAPSKKAATKKAPAKKAKAGGANKFAPAADKNYEIVAKYKGDGNPYRKGTTRHDQFLKLGKYTNTADFKKAGGEVWILRIAVRDGYAKEKKAA